MGLGIPIIDKILGIGEKVIDRVVPDNNKRAEEKHEERNKQADITLEGERAGSAWYTPRKLVMYVLLLPVVYMVAIRNMVNAFFPDALPAVDVAPALKILMAMLGLGFE
jgi:hypothetical protein